MGFILTDAITQFAEPYVGNLAAQVIAYGLLAFVVLNFVMAAGGLLSFVLRKVMARIHTRLGPNRVGPFGLLQFIADGVKMIAKEPVRPAKADKWTYEMAPYLVVIPIMLAFIPIPFADGVLVSDIRVGILFVIAVSAIAPVGEIVAGWASNNKYSTYGAIRAASLDVSYEVPMVIAAASVILLAGSLSTQDIIAKQQPLWYVFLQPVGAFIFFVTALAKAGVIPTDLGESESELIAGYFTEYGGMKFGMIQLGTFVNVVFISILTVILFFGGWSIPFVTADKFLAVFSDFWAWTLFSLLGVVVFLAKVSVFVLIVLITMFTLPRMRPDQFLGVGWKVLFPLSLVNLVATAAIVYFLGGM
jgi:NADH:ubiquinone oxidoreductase subunit H